MNIITQLVQFIFFKREVKDIDYSPAVAVLFFAINTALMLGLAHQVNHASEAVQAQSGLKYIPYEMMLVVSVCFTALYYSLFAAQQKQSRFIQTVTAYFGSSVLLSLVAGAAGLIPSGILIVAVAQGLSFACSVRATMQSLDYTLVRAIFSLIGITLMALIVGGLAFPPVPITTN